MDILWLPKYKIYWKWQPIHGLTQINLMFLICKSSVYNKMDEISKWYTMRPTHSSNIRGYKQVRECLIVVVCGNPDVSHKGLSHWDIQKAKDILKWLESSVLGITWADNETVWVTTWGHNCLHLNITPHDKVNSGVCDVKMLWPHHDALA